MTENDIKKTDGKVDSEGDFESDYEEVLSESGHIPKDDIEIVSDEGGVSKEVELEVEKPSSSEIKAIVEDEIIIDDFDDEYSSEDDKGDKVEILTDTAEIEDDESNSFAEHTNVEVASIIKNTGNILDKICEEKKVHIEKQKALISENELLEKIDSMPSARGFVKSIKSRVDFGETALIAEAKKASPSKGLIRHYFDPAKIAKDYESGGATCISVLTDEHYFQGSDEYVNIVKENCNLPILRKDFILDAYQVVESRAIGADCILLIMAILSVEQAIELEEKAIELGMDVLVEIHDAMELEKALKLKTNLIGINNRDLKNLDINLGITETLYPMIPNTKIVVCESGIYGFADIVRMNNIGVRAFLVGDALMSQDDLELATKGLLGNVV